MWKLDYVIFQMQWQDVLVDTTPNSITLYEKNTLITGVGGEISCNNVAWESLQSCNEISFTIPRFRRYAMPRMASSV